MSEHTPQPDARPVVSLCPEDAAVVDALLAQRCQGLATGPMPPGSNTPGSEFRAQRVRELMGVMDMLPTDAPDAPNTDDADEALVARTLEAVSHARQRERFAEQVQMVAAPRRGFGFDWRQVVSVAAIFLIAASLLLPVLERNQAEGDRLACAANLAMAGQAFGNYAVDHQGQLPRQHSFDGEVWWDTASANGSAPGSPSAAHQTNASNLYLLVRGGYIQPNRLTCPSNDRAAATAQVAREMARQVQPMTYSYQNQYRLDPIELAEHPDMAILADKNPIFVVRLDRVVKDPDAPVDSPSRVHGQRGQNILIADGHVVWTVRPTITRRDSGEDNVWISADTPDASAADSFLVP